MKTIRHLLLAGGLLLLWASAGFAGSPSKILAVITPEIAGASGSGGAGLSDDRCIAAEHVLAEALMKAGYKVVTSVDLAPGDQLTEADLADIRRGNPEKVKKAAVIMRANAVINGFIASEITDEALLGMELKRVVTTLSYKLHRTATGDILAVETGTYTDVGKSPKNQFTGTLSQMADDVAGKLASQVPLEMPEADVAALSKIRIEPGAAAPAASHRRSDMSGGEAPQILILNPPLGRGFSIAEKKSSLNMEGMVIDHSKTGISYFKINDQPVKLDPAGAFSYGVDLRPGENSFELAAMSNSGKMVKKEITISRPEDKTPPEISISRPLITRGFTTVVKSQASDTAVEGTVVDESGIQYLHINGEKVPVDARGGFSAKVALSESDTKISLISEDVFGNIARKEFFVSRGGRGAAVEGASGPGAAAAAPVLWALGVGVSDYGSTMLDLQYAAHDVQSVANFFEKEGGGLFSEVRFKVLVNDQVTRDSIIEAMASHLGQAGPDDVVLIFIAGHGIKHRQTGSYYFVPYDADNDTIVSKGLRMSDFEEAVNILSKNVNKVIIAMDTCHSGAMEIGMRAGVSSENLAETLREASGLYIVSASKAGETSMEGDQYRLGDGDKGHGAFTYALLKGMKGGANYDEDLYISLNELFQYVSREVPRLTGGRQHPYLKVSGTDLPLILLDR